ncbi:MAG: hypothetical protein K1X79_06040 [Oligoflexia bacterium]|nr:hypothetical protein [Oligoflexia bacterium]
MASMQQIRNAVSGALIALAGASCASAPEQTGPTAGDINPPPVSGPLEPGTGSSTAPKAGTDTAAAGAPELKDAKFASPASKPQQGPEAMTVPQRDEILKIYSDLPATALAKLSDAEKTKLADAIDKVVSANRDLGLAVKTGGDGSAAALGAKERVTAASGALNSCYREILVAHPGLLARGNEPAAAASGAPASGPAVTSGPEASPRPATRGKTVGELLREGSGGGARTPVSGRAGSGVSARTEGEAAAPKPDLKAQITEAEGRAILARYVADARLASASATEAEQIAAARSDEGRARILEDMRRAIEDRGRVLADLNRERLEGLRSLGEDARNARSNQNDVERQRAYVNFEAAERDFNLRRQEAEMWGQAGGGGNTNLFYLGALIFGGDNTQQQTVRAATAAYNARTAEAGDYWERRAREASDAQMNGFADMAATLRAQTAEFNALNTLLGQAQARELQLLRERQIDSLPPRR